MKPYRFSPIHDRSELFEVVNNIHVETHRLCKKNLGYHLPVAGNISVFCHYEDEYVRLTKMRKELTEESDNWNQKYFRLHKPIVISPIDDLPKTIYTYLYIRKPDINHPHVGNVDFYLEPDKFRELKQLLESGKVIEGVKIFERSDLDLIRLSDPSSDVSAYIGQKTIDENVRELV